MDEQPVQYDDDKPMEPVLDEPGEPVQDQLDNVETFRFTILEEILVSNFRCKFY